MFLTSEWSVTPFLMAIIKGKYSSEIDQSDKSATIKVFDVITNEPIGDYFSDGIRWWIFNCSS